MAHRSVKVLLDDTISSEHLADKLLALPGIKLKESAHAETDNIYNLLSNHRNNITLKHREYGNNRKPRSNFILENTDINETFRTSMVSVAYPRGHKRDTPLPEILGDPDYVIRKTRQVFSYTNGQVRFYLDTYHAEKGDKRFLEIQLEASSDARRDRTYISDTLSKLGLSAMPRITDPYSLIVLGDILPKEPSLMSSLGRLPANLLKEMMTFDTYHGQKKTRLMTQGDTADVAYMITKGTANVLGTDVTLRPGQLVGEFGFIEGGTRTFSVDVSPEFEAKVLPTAFTQELLLMPSYADKYMRYRMQKAGLQSPPQT